MYSITPLTASANAWFRGYALKNDRDIRDLSVGILYKNVEGKDNVTWDDTGYVSGGSSRDMPDGKIFHTSSNIVYRVHSTHTYLGVSNLQPQTDRVGVFSFEAKRGEVVTNSAIVLTSDSAIIVMEYRTLTVGIGESVTINLSKGGDINNLRWRHNYGDEIHTLRGSTSAVIDNIRMKDDGVYECYTGDIPDGNNGIMRLIVRACPSPKWNPPDCEMDCPVCYNGGVCDDKTGVCICPAGFKGTDCLTSCGNNIFGRDCEVVCSSSSNSCEGALICQADPVGCTCANSFTGNDCKSECEVLYPNTNIPDENLYYGADCRQKCNCANDDCNQSPTVTNTDIGCTSESTCSSGYTGDKCLEPTSCSSGFFGVLCNFPCHCKGTDDCNRDGSCANGCHEAWAGPNCSKAMPYRSEPPTVVNKTATTLTFDVTWILGEDYGTGKITKRKLSYKSSQMDSFILIIEEQNNNLIVIDNLTINADYQFYSQFSRMVGGIEVDGPRSAIGSTNTICTKPLVEPEIELKAVEDNLVILGLKPVSDEYYQIQCNHILRYQVQYADIDGNVQGIINTTSSSQLEVELSGLSSCTAYVVNARVVNNMEIPGSWGQDFTVQTAPSEPSIESTPFTNGTHLLMKWKASTCENQVTYLYKLSGDTVQQGITIETSAAFDLGIGSIEGYTFTVLASYLKVNGTPDSKQIMFETDCDNQGCSNQTQGYVISFVIGSIISAVIAVAIALILKRFKHSEKDVGNSSTAQPNVCTIDTDYQTLSKKYEQSAYEDIMPTDTTSSAEHVYANPEAVLKHVYTELEKREYEPVVPKKNVL